MAAASGEVVAAVHCGGECLWKLRLEAAEPGSGNIAQLKQECMAFMTGFMKQKNLSMEEVDLMEEVVSDGEEGGKGRKQKGKKRKQQDAAKT